MEKLAIEYGDGLYALAEEEGLTDVLRGDAADVRAALIENPGYISLMTSRKIDRSEKEALLSGAFKGKVHPYLYSFLLLMNERGYFPYLTACLYRYEERYLSAHGVEKVFVYTVAEPDDNEKTRIRESIEKKTGKKVDITWKIDKSLLAGVRVEADGLLMEYSARQRIEDLKRHLGSSIT